MTYRDSHGRFITGRSYRARQQPRDEFGRFVSEEKVREAISRVEYAPSVEYPEIPSEAPPEEPFEREEEEQEWVVEIEVRGSY